MQQKPYLEHADVQKILEAARAEAWTHHWAVSISVVDDGGHLLGFFRLDGAPALSAEMSTAKARTAVLGKRESRHYEEMINQGRIAFLSAPSVSGMLEGAVPITLHHHVIGAVGVSGVKSNEDAQIARAGIAAVTPI
jgi:glc operon protein GlcG